MSTNADERSMPIITRRQKWPSADFLNFYQGLFFSVLFHLLVAAVAKVPPLKTAPLNHSVIAVAFAVAPSGGENGAQEAVSNLLDPPKQNPPRPSKRPPQAPKTGINTNAMVAGAPQGLAQTAGPVGAQMVSRACPPQLIYAADAEVHYPTRARHMRIEGVVKLKLTVDKKGHVSHAEIIEGPGFGLSTSALKLAQKLRFLPATDEYGERQVATVEHEVVFRLNRSQES
jgi:TonB family protein